MGTETTQSITIKYLEDKLDNLHKELATTTSKMTDLNDQISRINRVLKSLKGETP